MPVGVFEFIPDEFATRHIFVADSAGSFTVFEFLAESGEELCGSVFVILADDSMEAKVIGALLRVLEVESIEIFPSRIYAVRHLQSLLFSDRIGTRLYVAGTETLYGLVAQLCEVMGMDGSAVVIAR
jgi:hypothetical protein